MYASTAARCSSETSFFTSGCSGASTTYETPNTVSQRVVNTLKVSPLSQANSISQPVDLPIQLRCISFVFSGQSMVFSPCKSSSAYWVILKYHCVRSRLMTGVPQRSQQPSTTCSLASTVLQLGHQLTGASLR